MNLLALQRDFQRHLIDAPNDLTASIGAGGMRGLPVYHNAYRVQLTDCLSETFAQTLAWLGGEAFVDAARHHIERTPPHSWTLGVYGDGFDHTLAAFFPNDAEVVELARLEWMLSRAFEDGDTDALPAHAIAGIDWDRAALVFAPSLRTAPALTNAGAIWSALAAGEMPPAARMLPAAGAMLVWRQDFTPRFRTIETIEHAAITLASSGAGFAALCAMLVEVRGENEGIARAGQMLGQWFADGLILRVEMKDGSCD